MKCFDNSNGYDGAENIKTKGVTSNLQLLWKWKILPIELHIPPTCIPDKERTIPYLINTYEKTKQKKIKIYGNFQVR